jgi:predicted XRE-type DNA-binding protein
LLVRVVWTGQIGPSKKSKKQSDKLTKLIKRRQANIPVTAGSDNVFADLGFAEPEEEPTKTQLASQVRQIIKERRLTQAAAATLMGIDQPKVSALLNGRLANFSAERLMRFLIALDQDVEIVIKAKARTRQRGRIRVVGQARA